MLRRRANADVLADGIFLRPEATRGGQFENSLVEPSDRACRAVTRRPKFSLKSNYDSQVLKKICPAVASFITFLAVGQPVRSSVCPDGDDSTLGKFESAGFVVVNQDLLWAQPLLFKEDGIY